MEEEQKEDDDDADADDGDNIKLRIINLKKQFHADNVAYKREEILIKY